MTTPKHMPDFKFITDLEGSNKFSVGITVDQFIMTCKKTSANMQNNHMQKYMNTLDNSNESYGKSDFDTTSIMRNKLSKQSSDECDKYGCNKYDFSQIL